MELELRMTADELNTFLDEAFDEPRPYRVDRLAPGRAVTTMPVEQTALRPGGTIGGPTLMLLADATAYAVVLAHVGPVALAVTSHLGISFLRKPRPAGLRAEAELLRLGRSQAVVDVRLLSEADDRGDEVLVAQATVTYAIPTASPSASA